MSIYNSDQNLWMHKYRYTLQRLEKEEKEWRRKEGILKLIATWLVLAADQRDDRLNIDLQELRSLLRSNQKSAALQSMAEKLGISVARLNKVRKGQKDDCGCIDLFVQVLDTLQPSPLGGPDRHDLIESLKVSLQTGGQSGLIEASAALFAKSLQSRAAMDHGQQYNPAPVENAAESASEVSPKLHEVLIQLMQMLEFPLEIRAQADVVIKRMRRGIEVDEIDMYLAEIVDLALRSRLLAQNEKQEMERFLKGLSAQLSDIDHYLLNQEVSERQTKELRDKLSDNLDEEVGVIETTLHEASDLETVKSVIQERLDTIHGHLDESRQVEAQRAEKAEAENQRLQAQLKNSENVTADLIDKLYKERELAVRDPLTGLYNRIAYEERIKEEIKRWRRYKHHLSLIIMDIDRFKRVNDNYGHRTGDRLLRFLADVIQGQIRETDMLVRFGGEEFVILASNTSQENACILARKTARCRFSM